MLQLLLKYRFFSGKSIFRINFWMMVFLLILIMVINSFCLSPFILHLIRATLIFWLVSAGIIPILRISRNKRPVISLCLGFVLALFLFPSVTSARQTPVNDDPSAPYLTQIKTAEPESQTDKLVMTYLYNAPESAIDVRYEYQWEILRTALEKTRAKYGAYRMVRAKIMTEKRQAFELMHPKGEISVMYLGTTPDFEKKLIGIHIPVDKDLGGYCLFLIRKDRKDEFHNIAGLEDLRKFSYGLGLDWIDVGILQNSGFKVVTGSSYDGLFEMLIQKRFDIFLRAAVEILDEVEERKQSMPDLYIEDSICFYYPMPMYFWFSKTGEGKHLAERAEEGMRMMIADGTYDQIFDKYQQPKIEKLHLKTRKFFSITNPLLGPETPFNDKRLWFDPNTYKPTKLTK